MIITTKLLRCAIRDALEEAANLYQVTEDSVPSETRFKEKPYDRNAARAFNDANTYPDEIIEMCDEITKILRLPDNITHSLSGRAKPENEAVAERIRVIKKLAKDLASKLEKNPI